MGKYLSAVDLMQCNDALMESFIIQSDRESRVISRVSALRSSAPLVWGRAGLHLHKNRWASLK